MEKTAKFEKVSLQRFQQDLEKVCPWFDEAQSLRMYESIRLPVRATKGSAGYDFFLPFDLELAPQETIRIPSGIRCRMTPGWVLILFPRSSLGTRYGLALDNTVGIIDADYYEADNEGHILIQLTNHSREQKLQLQQAAAYVQGIFLPFGITVDDDAVKKRIGGFGSTGS